MTSIILRSIRRCTTSAVRIGCASGFWGDTICSTPQLVHGEPKLDFIVYDFLSEITMALLLAAKTKDPALGYTPDFVLYHMAPNLEFIKRKGIRVISNAGGINPLVCGEAVQRLAKEKNLDLCVAVITGDDLTTKMDSIRDLRDMFDGKPLPKSTSCASAYFGAGPIARALDLGADVVITGRFVDSALALGPLIHKFHWKPNDFDKLALGSLAGHLIECGAQVTGGIFSDWKSVENWSNIGFPIVEFHGDRLEEFILTKPKGTGGVVNFGTVAEQMVYEIGNPAAYLLPDVVCDFTNVQIRQIQNRIGDACRISKAKGFPPSNQFKICATYVSGFKCTAVCPVVGPSAAEKSRKTAEAILARCRQIFKQLKLGDFTRTQIYPIGTEEYYGKNQRPSAKEIRECVGWISVEHQNRKALEIFAREIAPAGTGMAPGLTTIVGGRPKVSPVLRLFSGLVPKKDFTAEIYINGKHVESYKAPEFEQNPESYKTPEVEKNEAKKVSLRSGNFSFRVGELAFTRSGDKGNSANIGVICRHPGYFAYLQEFLTAEKVAEYFGHLFEKSVDLNRVKRYEIPGIHGFNFVLPAALGGGGISSLRFDPQGKALGEMLSDLELKSMPSISEMKNQADQKIPVDDF